MKKQNKKLKKPWMARLFGSPWRTAATSSLAVIVLFGGYFLYATIWYTVYNHRTVTELSAAEQARELVVRSVDVMMRDTPIEPRTGDIYFPEAKLYLPRPVEPVALSYVVNPLKQDVEIGVVNRTVYERHVSRIMSTRTVKEVFERVPALQACARGVVLSYDRESPGSLPAAQLQKTIALSNGKQLYAFIDKGCPENDITAELLSTIRAY